MIRPRHCELRHAIILAALLLLSSQSVNAQANSGKIVFADEFGRLLLINADGTGQTKSGPALRDPRGP